MGVYSNKKSLCFLESEESVPSPPQGKIFPKTPKTKSTLIMFFIFHLMTRIIISGGEELYSVMCEDYCVIFNTWEGGYYGFIK